MRVVCKSKLFASLSGKCPFCCVHHFFNVVAKEGFSGSSPCAQLEFGEASSSAWSFSLLDRFQMFKILVTQWLHLFLPFARCARAVTVFCQDQFP
jgi:hypothetical protein